MKKNMWFPVLVVVMAAGILCAGCDTADDEKDAWSKVTSLKQLNGTWKGPYKQTIVIKEIIEDDVIMGLLSGYMTDMMESSPGMANISLDQAIELFLGDMKATASAAITLKINASARKQSGSAKTTLTFSGETINFAWEMIKFVFLESISDANAAATFNNTKHSITITQDIPEGSITDQQEKDLLASGLKINQNRKKIKVPAGIIKGYLPIPVPVDLSDLIMTKQ